MKHVEIFTDGACKGNPGPGGWGTLLRMGAHEKELSGGEPDTTNNRMEMTAVIRGLGALIEPCRVDLYSDSKYVIDGITKWVHGWKKRGCQCQQEAGPQRRSMARPDRADRASPRRMALGQGPRGPS